MKCNLCWQQKEATHWGYLKHLNFGPVVNVCAECYEKECKEGGELNEREADDKGTSVSD